jgi:glutamyl endopeptidase
MANEYGSSGNETTDDQGITPPNATTQYRTSMRAPLARTRPSLGGGEDDGDLPASGQGVSGFPMSFPTSDESGQDEGSQYTTESDGETSIVVGGVEGMAETAELSEEIGNPEGEESGEESYEATPAELQASRESAEVSGEETGEEGLFDVISGFAGGLFGESAGEEAAEAGTAIESGSAGEGQAEFFPFLAALVPMLVSSIGPMVAKRIAGKLSAPARQGIKRLAAGATKAGTPKPARNILSMFAKLLETASSKPGGESGAEVGEEVGSLVNSVCAHVENIIGTDNRKQITNTLKNPWPRICALSITFPSGTRYRGTGFFIGSRSVVTAGHCVYLTKEGGWARKVEVIPAANGSSRPNGSALSTTFRSVRGWVIANKPEHDYGCVRLPAGAFGGRNLGSFGFASFDSKKLLANKARLFGYPGDKPAYELWGMGRLIKTVTAKTLAYDLDTMGGMSGAPVYIKQNGKRLVVGVHNYGSDGGNSATRVTPAMYNCLKKWSLS